MSDSTATPQPSPQSKSRLNPVFTRLLDDAAIFPPGNVALDEAVPAFLRRREEEYADLVAGFVISDHRLADLRDLIPEENSVSPVPVSVVIGAGAGGLAPAASTANRLDAVELTGLEVALRDADDLAGNARRVIAAMDQALDMGLIDDDVIISVELPHAAPSAGWLAAVDELAARELQLKFRTGGVDADFFPSADLLGAWITAALDRETPFKCTAGLHNAVRHRDPETGFEHHGFLNVLLATRASLEGDDPVAVLREDSADALTALAAQHGNDTLARTRKWFTGFGSCSVTEPLDDLHALGLLNTDASTTGEGTDQ